MWGMTGCGLRERRAAAGPTVVLGCAHSSRAGKAPIFPLFARFFSRAFMLRHHHPTPRTLTFLAHTAPLSTDSRKMSAFRAFDWPVIPKEYAPGGWADEMEREEAEVKMAVAVHEQRAAARAATADAAGPDAAALNALFAEVSDDWKLVKGKPGTAASPAFPSWMVRASYDGACGGVGGAARTTTTPVSFYLDENFSVNIMPSALLAVMIANVTAHQYQHQQLLLARGEVEKMKAKAPPAGPVFFLTADASSSTPLAPPAPVAGEEVPTTAPPSCLALVEYGSTFSDEDTFDCNPPAPAPFPTVVVNLCLPSEEEANERGFEAGGGLSGAEKMAQDDAEAESRFYGYGDPVWVHDGEPHEPTAEEEKEDEEGRPEWADYPTSDKAAPRAPTPPAVPARTWAQVVSGEKPSTHAGTATLPSPDGEEVEEKEATQEAVVEEEEGVEAKVEVVALVAPSTTTATPAPPAVQAGRTWAQVVDSSAPSAADNEAAWARLRK